jgi:hypothetical protein
MTVRDEEKAESPAGVLDTKRMEAEADMENNNGRDVPSSTVVEGDEKEGRNESSSPPSPSDEDVAMPPVKPQESRASQGEKMKRSKIAVIMAALCVCLFRSLPSVNYSC